METVKDTEWLLDKIQDIKKRKRSLNRLNDPFLKKKIKKDLKTEYRSVKRSEKNNWKKKLKDYEDLSDEDQKF